jgi:glycosyltransferase involved in cell wall biosynthesis
MRIAIDAHAIGSRLTGNERYVQNLAEQLLRLDGKNEYYLFFSHEQEKRRWAGRAPNLRTVLVSQNPFRRLGFDFIHQLRRIRPDVFHYQYTGPVFALSPEVVTIHDISFEEHPEFFSRHERYRLRLTVRRAVKSARRIITVSEFSKSQMVRLLVAPAEKIRVIYNGVGSEFRPIHDQEAIQQRLGRYGLRRPYLLTVGNVSRRKNQQGLVRGFAAWLRRQCNAEHQLVLAGKQDSTGEDIRREATDLGLAPTRLVFLGYIPDQDLPYLYAGAELFLAPSLYEGFGLPMVEAMACGIPVIASRASCLPEVAGEAVRYVDPLDPGDIAVSISEIIEKTTYAQELVQRGLQRARLFRWEQAARQTLSLYQEVVEEGGGISR